MVQLTYALRGQPKTPESEITIDTFKEMDITTEVKLTEEFLTEINPKGQVPVLTHPTRLPAPITESLEIALYIADQYPHLLPTDHKDEILQLLKELHHINYFTLSFGHVPDHADDQYEMITKFLERKDISEKYQKALEFKASLNKREEVDGVTPNEIKVQEKNAATFLAKIAKLYDPARGPWLWGRQNPSVLDIHTTIFIARVLDVERGYVVPKHLLEFCSAMKDTKEWKEVYQGRKTCNWMDAQA